jgi:hypothetical protein
MKFFFEFLKIKSVLSLYAPIVFKNFLPCYGENKRTCFGLHYENNSNCENSSSNPLQIACCGIQEAACGSVNCYVSQR